MSYCSGNKRPTALYLHPLPHGSQALDWLPRREDMQSLDGCQTWGWTEDEVHRVFATDGVKWRYDRGATVSGEMTGSD